MPPIISSQSGPAKFLEWDTGSIQVCPRRELYARQSTTEHRYRLPPSRCGGNRLQRHQPIYHSSNPAAVEAEGDGLFAAACCNFCFGSGKEVICCSVQLLHHLQLKPAASPIVLSRLWLLAQFMFILRRIYAAAASKSALVTSTFTLRLVLTARCSQSGCGVNEVWTY